MKDMLVLKSDVLRMEDGLRQTCRCPHCGFLVLSCNMKYEKGEPSICRFCETKAHDTIGIQDI